MTEFSVSPAGESFPLPSRGDYDAEYQRMAEKSCICRDLGDGVLSKLNLPELVAVISSVPLSVILRRSGKPGFMTRSGRPSA